MSIQRAIVKGTAWLVGARWLVRGIGFVSTIILARLLVPAPFDRPRTGLYEGRRERSEALGVFVSP